jgi:hypothetical protein
MQSFSYARAAKALLALALSTAGVHAMAAGALAIDSNKGDQYGFSYDYPNPEQAEQRALRECGRGCHVVLRFGNGCGAYAADQSKTSGAYGWAITPSSNGAQKTAVSECQAKGGSRCMVRSWGCDTRK